MTDEFREQSGYKIVELIPALRAFARSFCRHPSDADDLVQETLQKALASIDQFEAGTKLKSWLFTIMRNSAYTRARKYNREHPGFSDCASVRVATMANQEWAMRGREVALGLNRLSQHHREILMLIGVGGASYDEAAKILECSIGTVKSRLNRARANLLIELGESTAPSLLEKPSQMPWSPESSLN